MEQPGRLMVTKLKLDWMDRAEKRRGVEALAATVAKALQHCHHRYIPNGEESLLGHTEHLW